MQNRHSAQEGRTFIETLAYIMIMITITAGIATMVGRGYYRYECSAIQQDLVDLHKAISKHYAADGHYTNIKWDDLCEDRLGPRSIMPERVCNTDESGQETCKCKVQKGRHIFDGTVDIGSGDCLADGTYCVTFFIQFNNLPQDICAQLGARAWSTTSGSDVERIEINNDLWYWQYSPIKPTGSYKKHYLPALVDDVANACHSGYDNTIRWYFN